MTRAEVSITVLDNMLVDNTFKEGECVQHGHEKHGRVAFDLPGVFFERTTGNLAVRMLKVLLIYVGLQRRGQQSGNDGMKDQGVRKGTRGDVLVQRVSSGMRWMSGQCKRR